MYLRRFSTLGSKNKKILRYSIEFDKIETDKSISNVSSEESFYDSELDPYFNSFFGKDNLESILSTLETEYTELLRRVETTLFSGKPLDQKDHERLSYFMYLQYVRTDAYRKNADFPISRLSKKAGHGLMMVQTEVYEKMREVFLNRRYIIGRAFQGKKFITSDNPVFFVSSIHVNPEDIENSFEMLYSLIGERVSGKTRGFDIVLPLNNENVLVGFDEGTSRIRAAHDKHFVNLDLITTINIIGGAAMSADKHIYATTRSELEYAVLLMKGKRKEIEERPAHVKEEIEFQLRKRAEGYSTQTNVYSRWLERHRNAYPPTIGSGQEGSGSIS